MKLQDLRFGVEIETVGKSRETLARAIKGVVGGEVSRGGASASYDPWQVVDPQGRSWKVVSDGSLNLVPHYLQGEIVTPVLGYDDLPKLQEVVRAVKAAGAGVDRTCGIHVHVDASAFDGRTLANLAKLVFKQEPLILHALQIQQTRLDRYTKPISPEFIRKLESRRPRTKDQLNRIWYGFHNANPVHYDSTRYHGVNFHAVWQKGTVEFRWFEGAVHAGKVKAYVQLVLAIAAKALGSRAASSRKRAFDPTSARYDFRVWLLRLGMVGDEFKTARKHLLAPMPGDSAFKRGRPKGGKPGIKPAPDAAEGAEAEAAGWTPGAPSIGDPEPVSPPPPADPPPPPFDPLPPSPSSPEVPSCAA
jgi:hypothetical protein